MMRLLIAYILPYSINLKVAYRGGKILRLPAKFRFGQFVLIIIIQ